jgi:hypothetical protein
MTDHLRGSGTYSKPSSTTYQPFPSDYQGSGYEPYRPPNQGGSFSQSQANSNGLYTISNQTSNYYPGQPGPAPASVSRTQSATQNLVSSQVTGE